MNGSKDPGGPGSFRDPKPIPPDSPAAHHDELAKPRAFLDRLRVHHVDLSERFLSTSDREIFSVDLMIAAVMNRSYSLIEGFIDAFDRWNLVVAAPVLRIQIDSLVRLAYMATAPSSEEIAAHLIRGGEFRKLQDKEGRRLTDRRLIELADTAHPWVKGVYEATSGWVHLSPAHMYATWQGRYLRVNREREGGLQNFARGNPDATGADSALRSSRTAWRDDQSNCRDLRLRGDLGVAQGSADGRDARHHGEGMREVSVRNGAGSGKGPRRH